MVCLRVPGQRWRLVVFLGFLEEVMSLPGPEGGGAGPCTGPVDSSQNPATGCGPGACVREARLPV